MLQQIQIQAIIWAIVGWFVKVVYDYYIYANKLQAANKKFTWKNCFSEHDQRWIMGIVGAVVLGLLSDMLYPFVASKVMLLFNIQGDTPTYDVRINILVGFCAILLIGKFTKSVKIDDQ